jgi:hypothetical protein
MRTLVFAGLAAALQLIAADPRQGIWKLASAHSDQDPPRRFVVTSEGAGIHFSNSVNAMEFIGQYDGRVYPMLKGPGNEVVMIRTGDVIDFAYRKDGTVVQTDHVDYSTDRNEMINIFTSVAPPRAPQVLVWDRTGGSKSSTDPFVGEWTRNWSKTRMRQGLTVQVESDGNAIRFSGDFTYTAKPDGNDYPVQNYRDQTVSLRYVDEHTVTSDYKRNGKISDQERWVVSDDGKKMTLTLTGTLTSGARIQEELIFERQ